jgi:hypothetical protein
MASLAGSLETDESVQFAERMIGRRFSALAKSRSR